MRRVDYENDVSCFSGYEVCIIVIGTSINSQRCIGCRVLSSVYVCCLPAQMVSFFERFFENVSFVYTNLMVSELRSSFVYSASLMSVFLILHFLLVFLGCTSAVRPTRRSQSSVLETRRRWPRGWPACSRARMEVREWQQNMKFLRQCQLRREDWRWLEHWSSAWSRTLR